MISALTAHKEDVVHSWSKVMMIIFLDAVDS